MKPGHAAQPDRDADNTSLQEAASATAADRPTPSKPRFETADPGFRPDLDAGWRKRVEVIVVEINSDGRFIGPDGKPYNTRADGGDVFLMIDTGKFITTRANSGEHPHLYNSYLGFEEFGPLRKSVFAAAGYWNITAGRLVLVGAFSGLFLESARKPKHLAQLRYALSERVDLSEVTFKHVDEIQGRLWWEALDLQAAHSAAEIVPDAGFIGSRNGLQRRISELIAGAGDDFWVEVAGMRVPAEGGLQLDVTLHPVRGEPGHVTLAMTPAADTATAVLQGFDPGPEPERTYPILRELHRRLSPWLSQSGFSWAHGTEQVLEPGSSGTAVPAESVSASTDVPVPDWQYDTGVNQAIAAQICTTFGIEVLGLDKLGIPVELALSVRNAVVDAIAEDPGIHAAAIIVTPMAHTTFAAVDTMLGGQELIIFLNENYLTSPDYFLELTEADFRSGWTAAPTGDPIYDRLRHELAHRPSAHPDMPFSKSFAPRVRSHRIVDSTADEIIATSWHPEHSGTSTSIS
jgi:hypothetical protein